MNTNIKNSGFFIYNRDHQKSCISVDGLEITVVYRFKFRFITQDNLHQATMIWMILIQVVNVDVLIHLKEMFVHQS